MKKLISDGKPLDVTHPGINNLTPRQNQNLKKILARRTPDQPLDPKDKVKLQNLQNLLQNGKPLNEKHPGYKDLEPRQKLSLEQLVGQKKRNGGNLLPKDAQYLEKLLGAIQLKTGPADLLHRGVPNLVAIDLVVFKAIVGKQSAKQPLAN